MPISRSIRTGRMRANSVNATPRSSPKRPMRPERRLVSRPLVTAFCLLSTCSDLESVGDRLKDVAHARAQRRQHSDADDRDEEQNERVLDERLSALVPRRCEKSCGHCLGTSDWPWVETDAR